MSDRKKLAEKLLYPPVWVTLLLVILSAAGLILVFVKGWDTAPAAYAIYVFAFCSLTVLCVLCSNTFPSWYRKIRKLIYNSRFGRRCMTDAAFRTHVSLYCALVINLLYVGTNVISGIVYRSAWFCILAAYYSILAVMRFLLLRFVSRVGIGQNLYREFRRSRLCGIILLFINLTLTGAVLMILYSGRGFRYNGIMIYVMALYTFYITVHSIIQIVRYRRYNSPVMSAAKIIGFSAALVSMLSLETAMLTQFGTDMLPGNRNLMIALTGAGVSVVVVAMAVYMIVRAAVETGKMREHTE